MAFRKVSAVQVKEALRRWLRGEAERIIANGEGVDRKTAMRSIASKISFGVEHAGGEERLTEQLIGQRLSRTPGSSVNRARWATVQRSASLSRRPGCISAHQDLETRRPSVRFARLLDESSNSRQRRAPKSPLSPRSGGLGTRAPRGALCRAHCCRPCSWPGLTRHGFGGRVRQPCPRLADPSFFRPDGPPSSHGGVTDS